MTEIPLYGDRAARDSLGYPELHSSDLAAHAPREHMPELPNDGESPWWSDEEHMWIARPVNAIMRFRQNDLQGYYSADDAGFAACLAACSSGDKLYLPFCVLLDDYTIDMDLWIFGTNNEFTTFRGTLTLQANVIIYHCLISKYYSTELCTTIKMDAGCASLAIYNSQIYTNSIDGSIGIEMAEDSQALYMFNSMIYSLGDGHGIEVTSTNPGTCFAELSYVILNCVYAYNPTLFANFYTSNCWFASGVNTKGVPGSTREGHQILDDSSAKTQRSNLNFIGFDITDHSDTDTLDIEAPGGGGDAADITYTPDDATDWVDDTDPGNVDGALDQLADRVVMLEEAGPPDASDITYDAGVVADWDEDTDPGDVDDALNQLAERVTDIEETPAGPDEFTELSDAPSSYSGKEGNYLRVNTAEDALVFQPPLKVTIVTESVTYDLTLLDQVVLVDAAEDDCTVNFPDPATASGLVYIIKKIDSSAYVVQLSFYSGSFDGTAWLSDQYEAVTIVCDGTNWHTINRYIP